MDQFPSYMNYYMKVLKDSCKGRNNYKDISTHKDLKELHELSSGCDMRNSADDI